MHAIRRIALVGALAGSFVVGGTVSAIGVPTEPQIVSGLTACVLMDKAAAMRIPASRLPVTANTCATFTRLSWLLR